MLKGRFLAGMLCAGLALFTLGFYFSMPLFAHGAIALGFLFLLSLSYFVKNKRVLSKKRKCALLLLAFVLLGIFFGSGEYFRRTTLDAAATFSDGNIHTAKAEVTDIRYAKPYGSAYVAKLMSLDGKEISVSAVLELPFDGALAVGDRISFSGETALVSGTYEYYHRSRGILLQMTSEDVHVEDSIPQKRSVFDRIRTYIGENFEEHIGGKSAGYATALLTGNKDALDGQTSLAYQRLGISHVLAVSGMHFSVIVGGLDLFLRALTLNKRKKNTVLILFSVFFAGICGFSASILRALIMFCIYYIADLFGEQSDPLTSLSLAASGIVLANPYAVYDAGFWLSVLSTLGILSVMPMLQRLFHAKRSEKLGLRLLKKCLFAVLCMTVMNLTALFFTMPVTYLLFGGISLISPFANLIFIPLTEFILYLLILLTLVGFIPVLGPAVGALCRFLIELADGLAMGLSDIRGIYLSIRYPFGGVILIGLSLGVLVLLFAKEFRLRRLFALFSSAVFLFAVSLGIYTGLTANETYLRVLTDGKSDVLMLVDDGETALIDIGTGGKTLPLKGAALFSEYYRCEIDVFVLTHLHEDHAGAVKSLSEEIKLHRLLVPLPETEKEHTYLQAIESALEGSVEIAYYERNGHERLAVGDTMLTLPRYELLGRSTQPVIVLSAETEGIPAWIYCGASSMERRSLWAEIPQYRTVIFGTHGPVVKHIFDDRSLWNTELILFTSEETMALVEPAGFLGEMVHVKTDYPIRFTH